MKAHSYSAGAQPCLMIMSPVNFSVLPKQNPSGRIMPKYHLNILNLNITQVQGLSFVPDNEVNSRGKKKRKKYLVQETSSPLEANKSKGFLCYCGSFSSHHHHLPPPPWAPADLRSGGFFQPFPTGPEPEDPHPGYSSYLFSSKQNKIQSI